MLTAVYDSTRRLIRMTFERASGRATSQTWCEVRESWFPKRTRHRLDTARSNMIAVHDMLEQVARAVLAEQRLKGVEVHLERVNARTVRIHIVKAGVTMRLSHLQRPTPRLRRRLLRTIRRLVILHKMIERAGADVPTAVPDMTVLIRADQRAGYSAVSAGITIARHVAVKSLLAEVAQLRPDHRVMWDLTSLARRAATAEWMEHTASQLNLNKEDSAWDAMRSLYPA